MKQKHYSQAQVLKPHQKHAQQKSNASCIRPITSSSCNFSFEPIVSQLYPKFNFSNIYSPSSPMYSPPNPIYPPTNPSITKLLMKYVCVGLHSILPFHFRFQYYFLFSNCAKYLQASSYFSIFISFVVNCLVACFLILQLYLNFHVKSISYC